MSDLLKSIWEFLRSVPNYLDMLNPLQFLFCIGWAAVCVCVVVGSIHMGSSNPKHYTDKYVRSHMGEFHTWFINHPEDKARYE